VVKEGKTLLSHLAALLGIMLTMVSCGAGPDLLVYRLVPLGTAAKSTGIVHDILLSKSGQACRVMPIGCRFRGTRRGVDLRTTNSRAFACG
jgi:hypothetical protein